MDGDSKIRDAAEAVRGIVEAVPVYQDAVQPAAKEIGVALQTVAKTVHIALAPVTALIWGYEQFKGFISTTVAKKLENTPPEDIQTPKLNVAGPAIEALRFAGPEEELRELYANLLAASMDKSTSESVLPSFVEIIKQMTPDEAKLLRLFHKQKANPVIHLLQVSIDGGEVELLRNISALGTQAGCEQEVNTPIYLDNLCRLGLIEVPDRAYKIASHYEALENHPIIQQWKAGYLKENEFQPLIKRASVRITMLGQTFMKVCIIDHDQLRQNTNKNE